MKIAVFCSASEGVSPVLLSEMERVGEILAEEGHAVIYGGANCGCMGALASGVLRKRGQLIGVVPEMDFMMGLVQEGLTERHTVPTLSQRKVVMNTLADAFLISPGGLGTLDEALEVLAMKSTGSLQKPVVFYNFLGIWTPFLESLELLVESRLIRHKLGELFRVLDKPEALRENFSR